MPPVVLEYCIPSPSAGFWCRNTVVLEEVTRRVLCCLQEDDGGGVGVVGGRPREIKRVGLWPVASAGTPRPPRSGTYQQPQPQVLSRVYSINATLIFFFFPPSSSHSFVELQKTMVLCTLS